jgi:adenylate cyclase
MELMKKKRYSLFCSSIIILFSACAHVKPAVTVISPGVISINNRLTPESHFVDINQSWEFFWNRFVPSGNFYPVRTAPVCDETVTLPAIWNNLVSDHNVAKGKGSATWHLCIKNLKPETVYGIFLYDRIGTAGNLYCNTRLILSAGKASEIYTETVAGYTMKPVLFYSDIQGNADLVFHNSNDAYRAGGLWGKLRIAEQPYFLHWYNTALNAKMFTSGMIFIIVVYNILTFLLMNGNKSNLYLACFCFSLFLRNITAGFSIPGIFFPDFLYDQELKLEYLALSAVPLSLVLYYNSLLRGYRSGSITTVFIFTGIVSLFTCLLLPAAVTNHLLYLHQLYLILCTAYTIAFILRHSGQMGRAVSVLNLISIVVMIIAALHDIASDRLIPVFLSGTNMLSCSFVVIVIIQSAIAAIQQEQMAQDIDALAEKLKVINASYHRFVPQPVLNILEHNDIQEIKPGTYTVKELTLLAADIRNFTGISESLTAEQTFRFLNRYLKCISPVIRKYGGFIENYMGDGIVALFPDSSKDVFACAEEMQEELAKLRVELASEGKPAVYIGIGIHHGNVVIGAVGMDSRMTVLAVSSDVEMLTSIESFTKIVGKPVLVSEEVLRFYTPEKKQHSFTKVDKPFLYKRIENIYALELPEQQE